MKSVPFIIDASYVKIDDENIGLLFENNSVTAFLSSDSSSCISSAKGFGKTFLLKVKRKRIPQGIRCIPQNQELDTIANISFGKNLLTQLSDYHNWVLLWKLSISLAVIKLECYENDVYRKMIFKELDQSLLDILDRELCNTPCEILNHILSFGNKELGLITRKVASVVAAINRVNQAYAIFIDSVDEKLRTCLYDGDDHSVAHGGTDTNIWYYAQYSILEAIFDLGKTEKHIKVYCGIRQEANECHELYPTELHQQLSSLIKELRYSYDDLKTMFSLYVNYLDDSYLIYPEHKKNNPIMAFFGNDSLKNLHANETEEVFHYVYRHSLKRPRDIMDMCFAICKDCPRVYDVNLFKQIVNDKAREIAADYLFRTEPFLVDLKKDEFVSFFKYLNSNIFRKDELIDICSRYNKSEDNPICLRGECERCDNAHPFCTLYNVGLLGRIKDDEGLVGEKVQYFLPPGHSLNTDKSKLPTSELYFLHPSISDMLKASTSSISLCKSFVVGDSKPITQVEIESAINDIKIPKTIFLSSTDYDNQDLRPAIYSFLKNDLHIGKVLAFAEPDFPVDVKLHSHDNCIKNVALCDTFILIVGPRYGSTYIGTLYIDDLQKQYNREVSITWGEYWRACDLGKKIIVFLKESVSNDMWLYKLNKKEGKTITLPQSYNKPDDLLAFINVLQQKKHGNWRYLYRDIDDLKRQIREIIING